LIYLPDDANASEVLITYPDGVVDLIKQSPLEQDQNDIRFFKSYELNNQILQATAYRESALDGKGRTLSYTIVSTSETEIPISIGYQFMRDSDHLIAKGNHDISFVPIPEKYTLHQNFPNPFNPLTKIKYDLVNNGDVSIVILDITGRQVNQILNGKQEAGYHSIIWNGRNAQGKNVGAGVYFYMIQTKEFRQVKKMLLLK